MAFDFGAKYNRKKFDVDTTDLPYLPLSALYNGVNAATAEKVPYNGKGGEIFVIRALYINTKSRFGASPLCVIDGAMVNFPRHLVDTVNDILMDPEAINAINAGAAGFTVYEYQDNTYGKTCYGVNFQTVNPPRPMPSKKKPVPAPNPEDADSGDLPF